MKAGIIQILLWGLILALPRPGLPAAQADPSQEATALLTRAAELSDIRSAGTPPFRLRAHVRLLGYPQGTLEGTYLLVWVSPERWREEMTFPGYQQLRIANDGKVWRQRNLDYQPLRVWQWEETRELTRHLKPLPGQRLTRDRHRNRKGALLQCLELKGKRGWGRELCFDSNSGTLQRHESFFIAHEYADYVAWGNKCFPRIMRAYENDTLVVEAHVEELTSAGTPDATIFAQPSGAQEWPWCPDPQPAKALEKNRPPHLPRPRIGRFSGVVSVYAVIGADGKLHNATVVQTAGTALDAATLEALNGWRYQPATCSGAPVPAETVLTFKYELETRWLGRINPNVLPW